MVVEYKEGIGYVKIHQPSLREESRRLRLQEPDLPRMHRPSHLDKYTTGAKLPTRIMKHLTRICPGYDCASKSNQSCGGKILAFSVGVIGRIGFLDTVHYAWIHDTILACNQSQPNCERVPLIQVWSFFRLFALRVFIGESNLSVKGLYGAATTCSGAL